MGGAHSIAALSVNTPLDRTDAAALTPDGRLHLALTGDTHERLGLLGARSATSPGALPTAHKPGSLSRRLMDSFRRSVLDMHDRARAWRQRAQQLALVHFTLQALNNIKVLARHWVTDTAALCPAVK